MQMERWGGLHLRGFVRVMPDDEGNVSCFRIEWDGPRGLAGDHPSIAVAVSRLNNESSPRGPSYTRSYVAVDITRAKVEGGGHRW